MSELKKEDYQEPACPFCTDQWQQEAPVRPIDIRRVLERLDECLDQQDYSGAERILNYWLGEAQNGRDKRGELQLRNERMGFFRKQGRGEEALAEAAAAVALAEELGLSDTVGGATTWLNRGTVLKAFGRPEEAVEAFARAQAVYERELAPGDERLAGLYNNRALAEAEAGRDREAEALYEKALAITEGIAGRETAAAITRMNLADLLYARYEREGSGDYALYEAAIEANLEAAWQLLDRVTERDGYYAYVCRSCAPGFGFYGHFLREAELKERGSRVPGKE